MIADVKKIIFEISSHLQGSEQFTRPIDKMNSIGQIMGYIMPYMPIKLSEKQDLLEIVSVRERGLTFLYILAKQRENINLQIEVVKSDIHIHIPSGTTPKDGPSTGVTLFTALTSLITGKAADPKIAMTGDYYAK